MSIGSGTVGDKALLPPVAEQVPAVSPENVADPTRTFLVECFPYDTSGATTRRIGFSTGSATPHYDSFAWHPNIKTVFNSSLALFSSEMSPTNRSAPDVGVIEIPVNKGSDFSFLDSTGTARDIRTLEWPGRRIRILFGNDTDTFENFSILFDGKVEDVVWNEEMFSIELYNKSKDLEIPIQTNTFLGDGTLGEGDESLKGELKPLCYGLQRNIQPVQVDSASRVYTWHDGSSAEVIDVFDRGIELVNAGDIGDLGLPSIINWTPRGGYYVTDVANSLIRLGAEPDGVVTMDVRGDNTGGYISKLGDIIKRILTTKGNIDSDDIHQGDINQFNSVRGGISGMYLRGGVNINILLQQWTQGVNGYWFFDRLGIFRLKTLRFTNPKETIEDKDIFSIQRAQTARPITKSRVGYRVLGLEQDIGNLDLPSTTISDPYNYLTNLANSTQTGQVTYLDKVPFSSFDGGKPSVVSAGVWFTDPTTNVVNMRVEILFFNNAGGQVGDTYQGNFVTGATSATRSVVEGVDVPSSATSVTVRTVGDSGTGDVQNTFAIFNSGNVALPFVPGGVQSNVVNFNNRNDRNGAAIVTPTIASDGTAVDHVVNTDGGVDMSLEWAWAGDNEDIDGWEIYIRSSASGASYTMGTTASEEQVFITSAEKRAFIFLGYAADKYYTFGIRAYRVVDPDVDVTEVIYSSLVQPALGSEDPYLPEANVAFSGDISGTIDGVAASTLSAVATNFNNRNDRDGTAITAPTIATDGTAIDHVTNTDSSANISFEWSWGGTESDIDGFIIYTRQSTSATSYTFGASPAQEDVRFVPADRRAFFLNGVAINDYYTFGVQAYRIVDPDVNAAGLILSTLVQPSLGSEDPYQPSTSVSFNGDVAGTVNGATAADVANGATNSRPTMALLVNKLSTGTTSNNHFSVVGVNADGTVPTGTDGYFYWEDTKYTVDRNEAGSSTFRATGTDAKGKRGFLVWDTAGGTPFTVAGLARDGAFCWKDNTGAWKYDNGTTASSFTPDADMVVLGWAYPGPTTSTGGLYGSPVQLTTASFQIPSTDTNVFVEDGAIDSTQIANYAVTNFSTTQTAADTTVTEGTESDLGTTGLTPENMPDAVVIVWVTVTFKSASTSNVRIRLRGRDSASPVNYTTVASRITLDDANDYKTITMPCVFTQSDTTGPYYYSVLIESPTSATAVRDSSIVVAQEYIK